MMEDMRQLHDMGAIDDKHMEHLEREYAKAQEDNQPERFLRNMADCQYSHPKHGSNGRSTKAPLNKNKLKRMRKHQKQARKAQRA